MIPVLFVGIAIMFLCLAIKSHKLKSSIEKPHSKMIEVIDREIANEKSDEIAEMGWASITTYLYKTVNKHYRLEIAGFVIAAFAAFLEYLLAIGWR
jgi:hypothetical protein